MTAQVADAKRNFGFQFATILERSRLSKQELANDLGVTTALVTGFLAGRRVPGFERSIQLARLFGVTLGELLATEPLTTPLDAEGIRKRLKKTIYWENVSRMMEERTG